MSTTSSTNQIADNAFPYTTLIKILGAAIFLLVTAMAAYMVFTRVREQIANSDIFPDITIKKTAEVPVGDESPDEPETLMDWDGTDRITVLVLGIDERAQEEADFWRTDTIMLGTLDPVTMKAGVLSIPRDLWVHIPGYTENRINTAHALGDAYDHPGGGPALVVQTIEYNLGIEIDYYVRFNFQAFVELVDRIGGIEIEVPEDINDPCYPTPDYGCEELHIAAGPQHFFGEMALKYARVRYSEGGDFDRARRQQQVVLAIFERVTQLNLLPQLATQAPN
jgi:LCP family protein required for cell wall assembly